MARFFSAQTGGFYDSALHRQIPSDAVEISEERHADLLAAQAAGLVIMADPQGAAIAVVPARPSDEQLRAQLRRARNGRLTSCDWTQTADCPLDTAQRTAWAAYRQALRDLPETTSDLAAIEWPVAPA